MVADLTFDPKTLRVERGGQRIELAPIPLRILSTLMLLPAWCAVRISNARSGPTTPDGDALRAHIHALRSAIDRGAEALLHTVRESDTNWPAPMSASLRKLRRRHPGGVRRHGQPDSRHCDIPRVA